VEAEKEYDAEARHFAAMGSIFATGTADVVEELLQAEPGLSGQEVLDRLRSTAETARAHLAKVEALRA
jgi:hypothetical protein